MSQTKSIGNVNILDLRTATEQSVDSIREIGNVNLAIVTPETKPLLHRIQIGNTNLVVEVPVGIKIHQSFGRLVMGKEFFSQLTEPVYVLGFGKTIILPDVTPDDVNDKLSGMSVFGQFLVPTTVSGVLEAKDVKVFGDKTTFIPLSTYHLDSLTLETSDLELFKDDTEISILGSLELPKVLPDGLISRKIAKLSVTGRIVCHAENQAEIAARLVEKVKKMTVIPMGYELVNRRMQLDRYLLEALPGKNLYCTDQVLLEKDITTDDLVANLNSLITRELVLCPAGLRVAFSRICNPLETRVIFYEGDMLVINDSEHLTQTQLAAYPDKVTILVEGMLEIDRSIPNDHLSDKVAKIHNLGLIHCSADQMGVVRTKMGINEGKLQDYNQPEEADKDENPSGNINILTL